MTQPAGPSHPDLGTEPIVVTRDAGVATLWLNRPEKRNAVSYPMWLELAAVTESLAADPQVRALVVRGAGQHFCAGGDIRALYEAGRRGEAGNGAPGPFQRGLVERAWWAADDPKPAVSFGRGLAAKAAGRLRR